MRTFDNETTSEIVEYEINFNEIPDPQNHFDWGHHPLDINRLIKSHFSEVFVALS